jgi:hypothetical protein
VDAQAIVEQTAHINIPTNTALTVDDMAGLQAFMVILVAVIGAMDRETFGDVMSNTTLSITLRKVAVPEG